MKAWSASVLGVLCAAALAISCGTGGPGSSPGPQDAAADAGADGADGASGHDAAGGADSGGAPGCPAAMRLDELLGRLQTELSQLQIPGGATAIACADGTVVAGGVGITEHGGGVDVTGDTRFQIASVTKSLTAATAIQMEAAGLLDRSAPLVDLLQGINTSAPYTTSMQLDQLLAHSAGYPTELPSGNPQGDTLEPYFAGYSGVQLWAPPGRVWNYANYGYAVAGLALERAGGATFTELVRTHLLLPAGLDHISLDASAVQSAGDYSYGHSGSAASPQALGPLDSYYSAGWYGPMGGAWSSARDLARFAAQLLDEDPGAPLAAARREMIVPQIRTDYAPDIHYGQGLFIDESGDQPRWHHGGGVDGYLSDMQIFPQAGVAVVILINADWGFPSDTLEWASSELSAYTPSYQWGDLVAADVVGTYQDDLILGRVEISDDAGLRVNFVDLGFETELISWDVDTGYFYYQPWEMELTMAFWRDQTGQIDLLSCTAGVAARSGG